jgi:hypothetical protein
MPKEVQGRLEKERERKEPEEHRTWRKAQIKLGQQMELLQRIQSERED